MPWNGLGRTAPRMVQLLGSTVIGWIGPLLTDTSTAERSGATAAWIMTAPELTVRSGEVFSFNREPSQQVWDRQRRHERRERLSPALVFAQGLVQPRSQQPNGQTSRRVLISCDSLLHKVITGLSHGGGLLANCGRVKNVFEGVNVLIFFHQFEID